MKKRKLVSMLLAAAMTASLLAGCGDSKGDESSVSVSTQAGVSKTEESSGKAEEVTEPIEMEISFISYNCGNIVEGTKAEVWLEEKLEEKLGGKYDINITIPRVDMSNMEQQNLLFNTGEAPDCGWWMGSVTQYEDGITRLIPEEMIREYAPNYTAVLDADPVGWERSGVSDEEGMHYFLNGYAPGNGPQAHIYIGLYRYDWLQKAGIEPNGEVIEIGEGRYLATEPFTKSQYTEILKYFTIGDPDGNGVDDTIGVSMNGNISHLGWSNIFSIFGINERLMEEDGVHKNHYVTQSYKEMLKYAAELYKNGYIDSEFATLETAQVREKFNSGKVGHLGWNVSYVNNHQFVTLVESGATLLYTPITLNDDGTGGLMPYTDINYNYTFGVNADVDDEKLAVILQMFDFMCCDDEARTFLTYGEEGVEFQYGYVDKNGVKCGPAYIDGADTNGLDVFSKYWRPMDWYVTTLRTGQKEVYEYCISDEWKEWLVHRGKLDVSGTMTDYTEVNNKYSPTINQIVSEYFYNAVCGTVDIDATWDEYVKSVYDAGYSYIEEEIQKMPEYVLPE